MTVFRWLKKFRNEDKNVDDLEDDPRSGRPSKFDEKCTPFPDNPVKVFGQQNQYVALLYKHGKPVHGRAWNNGGVVECSFPMGKRELCEHRELGGQIQVLQYTDDHNKRGFWYNWVPYKNRTVGVPDQRQLVRCGDSLPILWFNRPQGAILGDLDINSEIARFSHDKIAEEKKGNDLDDMYVIVRELKGGPPTCECTSCKREPPKERVMLNAWNDMKEGDPFPTSKTVKALFKSLNTLPGEKPDQYVALWYQHGEPVMGRIWNDNGKIAVNFSWGGNEYKNKIGSMQVLFEQPEHVRGFDYDWRPYPEAASFDKNKEWHPVHVDSGGKGDISPGVIATSDGKQILGKVDVRNERACYGYQGKEQVLVGPAVHKTMVLCRKARLGCKFD